MAISRPDCNSPDGPDESAHPGGLLRPRGVGRDLAPLQRTGILQGEAGPPKRAGRALNPLIPAWFALAHACACVAANALRSPATATVRTGTTGQEHSGTLRSGCRVVADASGDGP